MNQATPTMKWYGEKEIYSSHSNLETRQVYVWIVSKDCKVAIVTKSNGKSQFPGGHPDTGENHIETALREVREEIGLDISSHMDMLNQFGYYIVKKDGDEYIQMRYFLQLPNNAEMYSVFADEKQDEERPVESAKWVDLFQLPRYIPWTRDSEEYREVLSMVS